jgi:hypothetical protein
MEGMIMRFCRKFFFWTLTLAFLTSPISFAANEAPNAAPAQNDFDSFSTLRSELLAKIGGSTKRVWIATDFLTDAEIVSSLYIAQYRKVNIQVLLGRDKATTILSRLNYLKQVNIPVALRPRGFYSKSSTMILVDDKLLAINSDLDYLTKTRKFTISEAPSESLSAFESAFSEAAKNQEDLRAKPLPLVGHPRPAKGKGPDRKKMQNEADGSPIQTTTVPAESSRKKDTNELQIDSNAKTASGTISAEGVYRYRSIKDRPTNGVATKLPKMTLSQELEKKRAAAAEKVEKVEKTPPPSSESP